MKKKKDEITIRSSAAEYLIYVASVGDQQDSIGTGSAICSRKQSISEGAMTALGISKRQEYYNREWAALAWS